MRRAGATMMSPASPPRWSMRSRWRLLAILFAMLVLGRATSAQTNVYTMRGNATPGVTNNIWSVNVTTGAETVVYANYPGGNAATLAQRPSDGMLFYAINGTNGAVYRFNPATPSIAPVAIGNLGPTPLGVNVSGGFRMAFSPAGTLYYMVGTGGGADPNTLYTVNQNTGQATKLVNITGAGDGGDIAFLGTTIYMVDQNRVLYTSTTAGGAATTVGTLNFGGPTPNTIGMSFDNGGGMLLQTVSTTLGGQYWSVSGTTATLISALSGGTTATGDMANINAPLPNLAITKTDGVTTVYRGGPVSYTIVVTNSSAYTVTGTVADTVPASVTGVTWTCVASPGSSCAAASGAGNTINTSAILEAGDIATYTVSGTITAGASGTLTNTATVAVPSWLTDSNPANNTATDSDTINLNANLGITKTDGVANVTAGATVTYTVVVSNAGPDTSAGSVVTDTVPAAITGVTWTCGTPTAGATCGAASGSGNSINTTANLPSGSSLTYTVTGTLSVAASGTLVNTATIVTPASGVSDPNDLARTGAGNNSATDNDSITAIPSVALSKAVSPSGNQAPGTDLAYTITFTNSGGLIAQTLVIKDPIPSSTDFKVGSVVNNLGTTGLTVVVAYSNNGGTTWIYTPVSGGGGAAAGYDRFVTNIRWTFSGNLSQTSPNNTGNVGFTSRIR